MGIARRNERGVERTLCSYIYIMKFMKFVHFIKNQNNKSLGNKKKQLVKYFQLFIDIKSIMLL